MAALPSPSKYSGGGHGQWGDRSGWNYGWKTAGDHHHPEDTPEQPEHLAIEDDPSMPSLMTLEQENQEDGESGDQRWSDSRGSWDSCGSWDRGHDYTWRQSSWNGAGSSWDAPDDTRSKDFADEMQKLYFGRGDGEESDKDESDEPPEGSIEADLLGILRGLVKSDSAKGQKFSREFKKAMVGNAEYKDASKAKIKTMRQKYAEAEVKTLRTERLSEESFEEVDWSKATYEPFVIIVQQEGGPGSDENFEAAKNYCRWCVKKGGRWIKYMKRSKRLNYAYLKEGFGEEIKKKWSLRKIGDHEDAGGNAVASGAGVARATVASVAVATPLAKRTAVALEEGKEGSGVSPGGSSGEPTPAKAGKKNDKGEPLPKVPRVKTPFDINMGLAKATNQKRKDALADASHVLKSIAKDAAWSWAVNEAKEVTKLVSEVETAEITFSKLVQLHEPKELRRMLGESMCVVEAESMCASLNDPVRKLGAFVEELQAMHRERSRLRNTRPT